MQRGTRKPNAAFHLRAKKRNVIARFGVRRVGTLVEKRNAGPSDGQQVRAHGRAAEFRGDVQLPHHSRTGRSGRKTAGSNPASSTSRRLGPRLRFGIPVPSNDISFPLADKPLPRNHNAVPRWRIAVPRTGKAIPRKNNPVPRSDNPFPRNDNAFPPNDNELAAIFPVISFARMRAPYRTRYLNF